MLDKIKQREVTEELNHPISWYEIKTPTTNLANYKATGLNVVPPNTFKTLNGVNLSWILLFCNQLCHNQSNLDECHEGQVVPLPPKGNTSDTKKLRRVILIYIGNNIYIRIMCG